LKGVDSHSPVRRFRPHALTLALFITANGHAFAAVALYNSKRFSVLHREVGWQHTSQAPDLEVALVRKHSVGLISVEAEKFAAFDS
jgi:hypothetical protein